MRPGSFSGVSIMGIRIRYPFRNCFKTKVRMYFSNGNFYVTGGLTERSYLKRKIGANG